jgi:hypothetical protein
MSNNENTSIIKPGQNGAGAALERVGFGTTELERMRETQGSALAARAQAEVQARYIVALQRPRNVEQFRVRLLEHCKRPGFARSPSTRSRSAARRSRARRSASSRPRCRSSATSCPRRRSRTTTIYKRVTRSVTDLERTSPTTATSSSRRRRAPQAEGRRRDPRQPHQQLRRHRLQDPRDRGRLRNKIGAACSKKLRNLGSASSPPTSSPRRWTSAADAHGQGREGSRGGARATARRRVRRAARDAADLDAFLGHAFDQASPAELDELRAAYVTVREGEAKWSTSSRPSASKRGEVDEASKAQRPPATSCALGSIRFARRRKRTLRPGAGRWPTAAADAAAARAAAGTEDAAREGRRSEVPQGRRREGRGAGNHVIKNPQNNSTGPAELEAASTATARCAACRSSSAQRPRRRAAKRARTAEE